MSEEPTILKHAREPHQLAAMQRINDAGYCPFCWENFEIEHHKPILWQGKHWLVTENFAPYPNSKLHLLLIYGKHALSPTDIDSDGWQELGSIMSWYERKYKPGAGALCMRFGSPNQSGASVGHLHAHLIMPDVNNEPIRFKIGSNIPKK